MTQTLKFPFVITHPTQEKKIPSTGAMVTMRPMLAREEKVLLIAKASGEYSEKLKAIKQILQACCSGIVVDKLTMFDLEYLFIQLRAFSVSNVSKVAYKDLDDNKTYDFEIDLYTLAVKFPESVENPVVVKDTDIKVKLRWPSIDTYIAMLEMGESSYDDKLDFIISHSIESITQGGKTVKVDQLSTEDLKSFLDELPIPTLKKIKLFYESEPSLFHELKYKNTNGVERTITLRTLEDFFTSD